MEEPTTPVGMEQEEQPVSLLDQLAAKRQEVADAKETVIPLPRYDLEPPLLLAKYRLLEGPEIEAIGRRIRSDKLSGRWDKQINAMMDMMIAALVGIMVDVAGDGTIQPLTIGGEPVTTWSLDLAKALKFDQTLPENPLARNIILGLFADNDLAIAEHVGRLSRWFTNTSVDVSEALLGGNP